MMSKHGLAVKQMDVVLACGTKDLSCKRKTKNE